MSRSTNSTSSSSGRSARTLKKASSVPVRHLRLIDQQRANLRRHIGQKLNQFRIERGFTILGLQECSGVARATITSVEAGTHLPSVTTLVPLSLALGVDIREFFPDLNGEAPPCFIDAYLE